VDVCQVLGNALAEGRDIAVNNEFFGCDPAFGELKVLRLTYSPKCSCDGRPLVPPQRPLGGGTSLQSMVEAWEHSVLELPPGTVGAVVGACYGAGETWVDVSPVVLRFVSADGSLQLSVNNELLGGDPLPGKVKSLRVSYTLHESRRLIADLGEWEVYEDFCAEGLNGCQGAPGLTLEDLQHARRRCLLLGCGGFWLSTGTVNQFGDEDGPAGCNMLRATQEQIRAALRPKAPDGFSSNLNRALRPGVHIAPQEFQADATWRPGNDPAPAPHVTWYPEGRYCAFASQIRVPPEGVAEATFYMCGGFFCGYAGIQQHAGERQAVLFSVWNASEGGRAATLQGGPEVKLGNFGNEGMGAKGGMDYPPAASAKWLPGTSYTFLVRAAPDGDGTVFTCHFHKPEDDSWHFIASVRRPDPSAEVQGRLGNPGGFIEDFCHTGARRSGEWGPCWVQRVSGAWEPVTRVRVSDGCGRPNKAAHLSDDKRSVVLIAGGGALDSGSTLFDGPVEASPPASCLASAPGKPATSGWAWEAEKAACGRPVVHCPLPASEEEVPVELQEWEWTEPLDAELLSAVWGAQSVWVDVRPQVERKKAEGAKFQVCNGTLGGDPCPGELKFLRCTYRLG